MRQALVVLVLPHDLAAFAKVLVHLLNGHGGDLSVDVDYYFLLLAFVVHGAVGLVGGDARLVVEIAAEFGYADAAKDTEDVALVIIEFYFGC